MSIQECSNYLSTKGFLYPRTCTNCGAGPCWHSLATDKDGKIYVSGDKDLPGDPISAPKLGRFCKEYRALTAEEQALLKAIKGKAEELEALIERVKDCRGKAVALTNLEQSIMWATQGLTS